MKIQVGFRTMDSVSTCPRLPCYIQGEAQRQVLYICVYDQSLNRSSSPIANKIKQKKKEGMIGCVSEEQNDDRNLWYLAGVTLIRSGPK